ncbi:hypothetical protein Anas_13440 [Armadillidium nasatum]|uniref:Uncharacterized protein n=1 Tax=Armadillidium nasatum TaxID=96803 RepID=A0A5N5SZX6_9CRUS|nr:hypothetical protein Anas_13440 [Armadillidium nasatum]
MDAWLNCGKTFASNLSFSKMLQYVLRLSPTKFYAFMLWLTIGALLYKKPTKMLSFSAAECVGQNSSSLNVGNIHEIISPFNGTMKESISDTSSINSLYQISYTLYI